jgi:Rad3-related DNA helicase
VIRGVPTPQQLGLPEKFDTWRGPQEPALDALMRSTRRVSALSAPTGFGKTGVYVGYALWTKEPTCFVTDNRGLQDQIMEDFGAIGMVDLRGRRNYPCDMHEGWTCEEGYAARCAHKGTILCPSTQAETRASISPLVVTNYDKWTSARKFGRGMDHFTQVVFDEGHRAPAALARAMQVILNYREIEDDLGVDFPGGTDAEEFVNWKPWAIQARAEAESRLAAAKARLSGARDPKPHWVREVTHFRYLTKRLGTIATANPNNWIVERIDKGYQFDPIQPGRYAEAALLLRIPRILVVSATLRPKTLYMMGIGNDAMHFQEFDSDFDPKRCPIYYVPAMRVDAKAESLAPLWLKFDQIAARRTDRKGICHTVSFARRTDLLNYSRFSSSMVVNEKGEAPTEIVELYKGAGPGAILVSPSVGAGYDFPDQQCEWQFVCKIPFEPPSKIVKAREAVDSEYRSYQAMQTLVQNFGRGMRSKRDQCENFICDMHLDWFLPRFSHLAPKWFHTFFQRRETVPPPPPRL